jgi:hypothetical protein
MDGPNDGRGGMPEHDLAATLKARPDALIRLAHFVTPDEAVAIATRLLDAGWDEDASAFANLLGALTRSAPKHWPGLAERVLRMAEDDVEAHGEIRGAVHDLLRRVGAWSADPLRERLVEWFVRVAGPGDARLAIEIVQQGWETSPESPTFLAGWCHPVAAWLVDHGAAELCRGDSPLALLLVIDTCYKVYPDRLLGALKITERSGKPDALFKFDGEGERRLYPAIEAALERGLPEEWVDEVIGGAGAALGALGGARFFRPLEPGAWMPRLRSALLGALGRGRWIGGTGFVAWFAAFKVDPPPSLLCTRDALESAFASIIHARGDAFDSKRLAAWAEVLTHAWFAQFGLRRPTRNLMSSAWSLDVFAAEPRFAPGMYRALKRALEDAPQAPELAAARRVMADAADNPRLASVALLLLPGTSKADQQPCVSLNEIRDVLETIVRHEWSRPVAGLDVRTLFRGARQVRITEPGELPAEILADFDGDTLLTGDSSTYCRIATVLQEPGEAKAVCAMYFVHEAVHVLQGAQRKSAVVALRATASEFTLAQLDLEADDLTARIVASATHWPLAHLKNLAGKGASAFPATMHHTNASITRKAVRLLSLRIDHLIRGHEGFGVALDEPGYAFVEVPFGAGEMLVMWSGAVHHKLVAKVALNAGETDGLVQVARNQPALADLDTRIGELLARAVRARV